ncbi:hypothetical protein Tco_0802177 [Tanacetum coccineum]|uniref:Zinc finger, CCHC-type n=1 Tax=Tanacetum coccineum TaxID=301880 RepID=A0ABQ4ZY16_9ASTR
MTATMKHMAANFSKLDKFEGMEFIRWQNKMHFSLTSMSVVYVMSTSIPENGDDATMKQMRKISKYLLKNYGILWKLSIPSSMPLSTHYLLTFEPTLSKLLEDAITSPSSIRKELFSPL